MKQLNIFLKTNKATVKRKQTTSSVFADFLMEYQVMLCNAHTTTEKTTVAFKFDLWTCRGKCRNVALLFNNRKQKMAEVTSLYLLEPLQYVFQ